MNILALRRSLLPLSGFCMPSDGGTSGGGDGGSSGSNGGNGSGGGGGGGGSDGGYGDSGTSGMQGGYGAGMGYGDAPSGDTSGGFNAAKDSQAANMGFGNEQAAAESGLSGSSTRTDSQGIASGYTGPVADTSSALMGYTQPANYSSTVALDNPVLSKIAQVLGFATLGIPGLSAANKIGNSVTMGPSTARVDNSNRTAGNEGGPQGDGGGGSGNSGLGAAGTNPLDSNGPKTTTGLPAAAVAPKYVWDGHKYVETATGAQTVMRPDVHNMFKQTPYSWQAPPADGDAPAGPPMMDDGTWRGDQSASGARPGVFAKGGPVGIAAGAPRLVHGPGDGQSDGIAVKMDDGAQGRLSDGEFVITADVVAALGNGSTEAGAKVLHDMMGRIRAQAHGSPKQPRPVNAAEVLPA